MAVFNKFNSFPEAVNEEVHNFAVDTIKVALCNAANPPTAADAVLADLVVVSVANLDDVVVPVVSSEQVAGLYKLVVSDHLMTALGAIDPFQYIVLYNDSALNDELICWFDRGEETPMGINDTLNLNFGTQLFSLS